MNGGVRDAVARALGADVAAARAIGGGDINEAFRVSLSDGRDVFVKTNARAPRTMFPAEAKGLAWLAEAGAIRIPEVLAVSGENDAVGFLALELIEPGRRVSGFDEELGRSLAALHRAGAPSFGLDHDNFIGRLPQENSPCDDWPTFYRERRLGPQLRMADKRGLATEEMKRGFDALFARLDVLVGDPEPPARLHGDLWGGNLHAGGDGRPCLIDPAVYGGHREIDLAMMQLFGGFGPRVFEAYDEAYPLGDGWRDRTPLYQLYFLMVHVNLFGSGYVGSAERALQAML